ncbi:MAG: right-handed parallel beta-helix repeat-containing protein [Planctomycetota bacterium]|nr:right-handed parallel beta-helix repeat-containing protein [Planctomycetota bacterium]
MSLRSTIVALSSIALATPADGQTTRTVCASGCQYTSINDAIDAASDGDLVLLAAETYTEGEPIDLDGKLITLRGAVDKSGGPATILDGAGTHTVLVAESGETTATVLENLIVQNGLASMWSVDDVDSNQHGYVNVGGLFMYPQALDGDGSFDDGTGLTLRNCTFQANVSAKPSGGTYEGDGGGVFLGDHCQLVLDGCTFRGNRAEKEGGGIRCLESCVLDLDDCLFESNHAGSDAGAIFIDDLSIATIEDCTFRSNTCDTYGGAFYIYEYCTVDITNCSFEGNGVPYTTADGEGDDGEVWDTADGGALYVQDRSVVTVTSSSFTGNESTAEGGAIDTDSRATIILFDCDFVGNRTYEDGGAVCVNGALLDATDCTFTGNEVSSARYSSDGGGAIHVILRDNYMPYNGLALTNCTFTANQTVDGDPNDDYVAMGGAILIRTDDDEDPEPEHDIDGCVFSDNVADSGGAIFIVSPDGIDLEGSGNLACGNFPDHLNATPPGLFFDCLADVCTDCTDTDEDGVPDFLDACPGGDDTADADSDGTPDLCDDCPNDPLKTAPGDCGCGVAESTVEGDRDCDGDYDADDVRLTMADFGILAGDADGDGDLDLDDRDALNEALGLCAADIDGDGEVDGADLSYVLGYWGLCSAP